jgi:DNA-binding FadR family transcriptional regulator
MLRQPLSSEFLHYLASLQVSNGDGERLPSLSDLSKTMGVSVALLREQLEVAKALGLVEVRPRTGIRRLPYAFLPAVRTSLGYAIELDFQHFYLFSDLRNHVEASYWEQAVRMLTPSDHEALTASVARAWEKLRGKPIQIPQQEHKQLHMLIFSRLDNPFVQGILEAYWEAYEAVGLSLYADIAYLKKVWTYHQIMVDAIIAQDYETGYRALIEHKDLLYHRTFPTQPAASE